MVSYISATHTHTHTIPHAGHEKHGSRFRNPWWGAHTGGSITGRRRARSHSVLGRTADPHHALFRGHDQSRPAAKKGFGGTRGTETKQTAVKAAGVEKEGTPISHFKSAIIPLDDIGIVLQYKGIRTERPAHITHA